MKPMRKPYSADFKAKIALSMAGRGCQAMPVVNECRVDVIEESLVALRVAHLSMIQAVITRMSGFSASAKTFTITIIAGLAAISLQADAVQLGLIAMIAAITLFLVDTYYMTLEVRFRTFYDEVAARDLDQATDMKIMPSVKSGDCESAWNIDPG